VVPRLALWVQPPHGTGAYNLQNAGNSGYAEGSTDPCVKLGWLARSGLGVP
jgi:hypothetical protein